jgi:L,D-transpeptidase YnhG
MSQPRPAQAGDAQRHIQNTMPQAAAGTMSRSIRLTLGLALLAGALAAIALRSGPDQSVGSEPKSAALESSSDMPEASGLTSATKAGLPPPGNGLMRQTLVEDTFEPMRPLLGDAEARLIEIYQHIGRGQHRQALQLAESLVIQHPNFHLAHLVHGDLLSMQARPIQRLGDVPDTKALAANEQLDVLRDESRRRLVALTERPPQGHIPDQILALAPRSRHAIAIDASRSRLYLFENQTLTGQEAPASAPPQLRLIGDFYISVGLSGIEKIVEGDQRTPLGVYYITGNLNPANLPDLYGVGALPINYPNALDLQRGKTGHGIWLHGTPRAQFVRAPQASDGCVVLSNPDLERLMATVAIRTTPVIIAPELRWVAPEALEQDRSDFNAALAAWRNAKSQGELDALRGMYSDQFRTHGRQTTQWWTRLESELRNKGNRAVELRELSLLRWHDSDETMVVNFSEALEGQARGVNKRQYWGRENGRWKIFFEGQVG